MEEVDRLYMTIGMLYVQTLRQKGIIESMTHEVRRLQKRNDDLETTLNEAPQEGPRPA